MTLALTGLSACVAMFFSGTALASRSVTVRDGLSMTTLANPEYVNGAGPECNVASFSPDGTRFVVVVRRGDLAKNLNRYEMLLWDGNGLAAGRPRVVLRMSSSSIRPAIDPQTITWSRDGQSLTFLGEHGGEHHQVFRLQLRSGRLWRLTNHGTSVVAYSVDETDSSIAYTATPPFHSLWDEQAREHGLVVTTQYLPDLITGRAGYEFRGRTSETELFVQSPNSTRRIRLNDHIPAGVLFTPWISPNGQYVVVAETVPYDRVPQIWQNYRNWVVQYWFSVASRPARGLEPQSLSWLERYVLVNTRTGQTKTLLDSPLFIPSRVVWAPDSRSVILSNVLLPIEAGSNKAIIDEASQSKTVEVNLADGKITEVGRRCYDAREWQRNELICDEEPTPLEKAVADLSKAKSSQDETDDCLAPKRLQFEKSDGSWHEMGRPESPPRAIVSIRENINAPPKIYWKGPSSKSRILLYDLNPLFKNLELGKVAVVTWKLPDGKHISGDLYYPPQYSRGRRYPLVIQTHGWSADRYMFFGPFPTAFAAQPLAARNIMVLQVNDIQLPERYGKHGQLVEVKEAIAIYRSAIEYLNKQGLIDPGRVGIIGFSHTCFYVKWALTHDPGLFAAATVNEGEDGGYLQYMTDFNSYVDAQSLYGGPPSGKHLKAWVETSPGFNLQSVTAPLLITVLNPRYVLGDWEWFQGLRNLGKPVEMLMLDGDSHEQHLLQRPRDRWISAGGTVEWFDFWLNGHRDRDLAADLQFLRLCARYQSEVGERSTCKRVVSKN